MTQAEPTVFVVDDDESLCESLEWMLTAEGFSVSKHYSAAAFLADYRSGQPGCLILDIRMPGMSGLELQASLAEDGNSPPIIFLTGHGDVPMAVRAVQRGALDFLEKPVNDQLLLERVRHALDVDAHRRSQRQQRTDVAARLASLTPRETEVMELVVQGHANKQIATRLGIVIGTVEVHRKHVLEKMDVPTTVDLVRCVTEYRRESPTQRL